MIYFNVWFLFSGGVYSTSFPEKYPKNEQNKIEIPAKNWIQRGSDNSNRVIVITFTDFNVDATTSNGQCSDYLMVLESNDEILLDKTCGNTVPNKITSSTSRVVVVFSTDNLDDGGNGWRFTWEAIEPQGTEVTRQFKNPIKGRSSLLCLCLISSVENGTSWQAGRVVPGKGVCQRISFWDENPPNTRSAGSGRG